MVGYKSTSFNSNIFPETKNTYSNQNFQIKLGESDGFFLCNIWSILEKEKCEKLQMNLQ